MLLPWFLNFIWVTPLVFWVVHSLLALPRVPLQWREYGRHSLASLGILFSYWTVSLTMQVLIRQQSFDGFLLRLHNVILSTGIIDFVIFTCILSVAIGTHFYHRAMSERVAVNQIKQELMIEQLKVLRSQLNPHFLFNTLNTITSLVRLKKLDDAVLALSELSTMLRSSLETKHDETIALRDEMQFINSYLTIQKMRFASKLKLDINVEEQCLNQRIPNMLLQPLVENAIEHGAQAVGQDNLISLQIHCRRDELVIELTNHVAEDGPHKGFGIGLNNTRKRLERIYSHFQFELRPLSDGLFKTLLTLPSQQSEGTTC